MYQVDVSIQGESEAARLLAYGGDEESVFQLPGVIDELTTFVNNTGAEYITATWNVFDAEMKVTVERVHEPTQAGATCEGIVTKLRRAARVGG